MEGEPNHISMMISQQRAGPPPTRYILAVPKIEQNFTGSRCREAGWPVSWVLATFHSTFHPTSLNTFLEAIQSEKVSVG